MSTYTSLKKSETFFIDDQVRNVKIFSGEENGGIVMSSKLLTAMLRIAKKLSNKIHP